MTCAAAHPYRTHCHLPKSTPNHSETIAELTASWPRSGVILIHDSPGTLPELISQMAACGEWFPVIAFSENPSASRIAQAILDGALDYVAWPFEQQELEQAIERAQARADRLGSVRLREDDGAQPHREAHPARAASARWRRRRAIEPTDRRGAFDQPTHGRDPSRQYAQQAWRQSHVRCDPHRHRGGIDQLSRNARSDSSGSA